jgi:hypothetical protein
MSLNDGGGILQGLILSLDFQIPVSHLFIENKRRIQWRNVMARGWESKSVENQIDDSHSEKKDQVAVVSKGRHINRPLRPSREKEALILARTRLLSDIQSTENPRYKSFLETSLAAVDKQISEIQ